MALIDRVGDMQILSERWQAPRRTARVDTAGIAKRADGDPSTSAYNADLPSKKGVEVIMISSVRVRGTTERGDYRRDPLDWRGDESRLVMRRDDRLVELAVLDLQPMDGRSVAVDAQQDPADRRKDQNEKPAVNARAEAKGFHGQARKKTGMRLPDVRFYRRGPKAAAARDRCMR